MGRVIVVVVVVVVRIRALRPPTHKAASLSPTDDKVRVPKCKGLRSSKPRRLLKCE